MYISAQNISAVGCRAPAVDAALSRDGWSSGSNEVKPWMEELTHFG